MIDLGDSYAEEICITKDLVSSFAEISGDKNPIHLDLDYAAKTPFEKPIAHGLLLGAFISKILGNHVPGHGTIYLKQELNFLAPVYVGETVRVLVKVVQKKENKPIYTLSTEVTVKEKKVVDGFAVVKYQEEQR